MNNKKQLTQFAEKCHNELVKNILPFWIEHGYDKKNSSFIGETDLEGNPIENAQLSGVLMARSLWTYAAAGRFFDNVEYKNMAYKAFQYLETYFYDQQYNGYYMMIDSKGNPVDTQKHSYIQAFVLYSICEFYLMEPNEDILKKIVKLHNLIEEKTRDKSGNPGYLENFSREWTISESNRMADGNEPKSMNTHLHILESYTQLHRVLNNKESGRCLEDLIHIFLDFIINPKGHFRLFFNNDFTEADGSKGICSFGHDIEGVWLLREAALVLNDKKLLQTVTSKTLRIADAVLINGMDKNRGIFLESTRYGSNIRTNKHWWPQAEAVVGFLDAYEAGGKEIYLKTALDTWDFIEEFVVDKKNGEWFAKVNRLGIPYLVESNDDPSPYYRNDRKIDPWKCPYHNSRACLEVIKRVESMVK